MSFCNNPDLKCIDECEGYLQGICSGCDHYQSKELTDIQVIKTDIVKIMDKLDTLMNYVLLQLPTKDEVAPE